MAFEHYDGIPSADHIDFMDDGTPVFTDPETGISYSDDPEYDTSGNHPSTKSDPPASDPTNPPVPSPEPASEPSSEPPKPAAEPTPPASTDEPNNADSIDGLTDEGRQLQEKYNTTLMEWANSAGFEDGMIPRKDGSYFQIQDLRPDEQLQVMRQIADHQAKSREIQDPAIRTLYSQAQKEGLTGQQLIDKIVANEVEFVNQFSNDDNMIKEMDDDSLYQFHVIKEANGIDLSEEDIAARLAAAKSSPTFKQEMEVLRSRYNEQYNNLKNSYLQEKASKARQENEQYIKSVVQGVETITEIDGHTVSSDALNYLIGNVVSEDGSEPPFFKELKKDPQMLLRLAFNHYYSDVVAQSREMSIKKATQTGRTQALGNTAAKPVNYFFNRSNQPGGQPQPQNQPGQVPNIVDYSNKTLTQEELDDMIDQGLI